MAYTREFNNEKSGKRGWRIFVSRGRDLPPASERFYWEEGWTRKQAEKKLQKAIVEFEESVKNGDAVTRQQKKEEAKRQALERAKIKTLSAYTEDVFLPSKHDDGIAEKTYSSYKWILNTYILPELGEFNLSEITPAMIQSLLLSLRKKDLSYRTITLTYNVLKMVFDAALFDDSIEHSPMEKIKRPKQSKDDKAKKNGKAFSYTEEKMKQILTDIKQEKLEWQAFIVFMADSWCRKGEVCALQWDNIDFEKGTVTICDNLIYIPESLQYAPKSAIITTSPKSGLSRTIDLGTETLEILKQWKQEQEKKRKASNVVSMDQWKQLKDKPQYVFTQEDGITPIHPDTPNKLFRRLAKKYGYVDFHPHKLRHTGASLAILHGADIASVSKRLGHADISTTLRIYVHATQKSVSDAGRIARDALKMVNG